MILQHFITATRRPRGGVDMAGRLFVAVPDFWPLPTPCGTKRRGCVQQNPNCCVAAVQFFCFSSFRCHRVAVFQYKLAK